MNMRIGGLASGIDTESMIKDLMNAERIPLDKMHRDRTKLEWKRDAFRDVNKLLGNFDQNMILNMKLSETFNKKIISSTQEDAVRATGNAGANGGTYRIKVEQLASSAINVSESDKMQINAEDTLDPSMGPIEFSTYDKAGEKIDHSYEIQSGDKLSDVIKRINDDKDSPVRLSYDENANTVILEATRTGKYNKAEGGKEITFTDSSFLPT